MPPEPHPRPSPRPAPDPIRDEFVLHLHTRRCRCGRIERTSELYVVTMYSDFRRLSPTKCRPFYRPAVITLPTETIAACAHCYTILPLPTPRLLPERRPRLKWRDSVPPPLRPPVRPQTILDLA